MADTVSLLNDRVLRGRRKRVLERPKKREGTPREGRDSEFIETVKDLHEAYKHREDGLRAVCESLQARFSQAVELRRAFEEEWYFAVRAWFQQFTEEREDSWESDRYLPIILKQVETALPAIVAAVLDQKGVFRLEGMTREGKNAAKALERLQNWQAHHYDFEECYEDMFWWAALIGTAYIDHGWDRQKDTRPVPVVRQDASGEKRKDFEEREILVADRPFMQVLNPLDVYPGPNVEMGDDGDWFFERVETTIGELRELAQPLSESDTPHIDSQALEDWIAEDKPQDRSPDDQSWVEDTAGATWTDWLEELGYEREADEGTRGDLLDNEKRVVVLKYRSKLETVTLASPTRIIGYSRNKNLHGKTGIVVHHFFKIPNCPFGRGIGGILQGHQELSNENINRWMDAVVIEAMAPIVVDKSRANLLDDELALQPNAILRTRGTDAIQRMQMPAPTNIAMTMDQHLARDADDLTGFTEQARGLAQGGQTATAFAGIQSNLQTRLIMHVRRSGRTIQRSGRLLAKLNQQFYSQPQIVSFVGEDGLDYSEIQPWEIVGDVVVGVSISPARANPEVLAQRLLQMLQVLVPLIQTGAIQQPQVRRLVRMTLEANDVQDVDLLLPKGGDQRKDAGVENILLQKLVPLEPHPEEPHDVHVQAHQQLLQELAAENQDGSRDAAIRHVQEHIGKHAAIQAQQAQQEAMRAQQAAGQGSPNQQAQGASGAGIGPAGGTPAQSAGANAAAATPGAGTPGVAAPGPAAPQQAR